MLNLFQHPIIKVCNRQVFRMQIADQASVIVLWVPDPLASGRDDMAMKFLYRCIESWQSLQTETSHSMGSLPILYLAYFLWWTWLARPPQ